MIVRLLPVDNPTSPPAFQHIYLTQIKHLTKPNRDYPHGIKSSTLTDFLLINSGLIIVYFVIILMIAAIPAAPLQAANRTPHYDFNANCIRAYNEILALRFDEGKRIINAERLQNPSNRIPVLLENYLDFLNLFLNDDPSLFKRLESNRSDRLNLLSEVAHPSPWQLFAQAAVSFQWSFTRARFGEFAAAAFDLTRAYNLIERNKTMYPDFYPNYLISGVLNVVIGAMPDQYRWLTGLVGMHGSVEEGRRELNALVQHFNKDNQLSFLMIETLLYMSFIEISLMDEDGEPDRIAALLAKEYPQNNHPLICYVRANTAIRMHRNEEAITILNLCSPSPGTHPLPYLDLLQGVALLNRLDPKAATYFHSFTQVYKTRSFVKTAFERLAWIAWLNADTAGYQRYMSEVLT
ncbi:MAG TPA: hypothetical protein VLH16_04970, partial [Bacteroidales bacterium]|nr:hypothetical protein [Bacteroidales bacterium]